MEKRLATSVKVDPNVWKEVKIAAINSGLLVQEYVDTALREKLAREKKK